VSPRQSQFSETRWQQPWTSLTTEDCRLTNSFQSSCQPSQPRDAFFNRTYIPIAGFRAPAHSPCPFFPVVPHPTIPAPDSCPLAAGFRPIVGPGPPPPPTRMFDPLSSRCARPNRLMQLFAWTGRVPAFRARDQRMGGRLAWHLPPACVQPSHQGPLIGIVTIVDDGGCLPTWDTAPSVLSAEAIVVQSPDGFSMPQPTFHSRVGEQRPLRYRCLCVPTIGQRVPRVHGGRRSLTAKHPIRRRLATKKKKKLDIFPRPDVVGPRLGVAITHDFAVKVAPPNWETYHRRPVPDRGSRRKQ